MKNLDAEATVERTKFNPKGSDPVRSSRVKTLRNEQWRLAEVVSSTGSILVAATNSKNAFDLQKPKDGKSFILRSWGHDKASYQEMMSQQLDNAVHSPWTIAGKPLRELVQEEEFTLKNIEELKRDGADLVQVDFEYRPKDEKSTAMRGGRLILSPSNHWAHRESRIDASWGGLMTETVEYGEKIGDVRRLERVTDINSNKTGDTGSKVVWEFHRWEHRNVPESEFTLAKFGLPDVGEAVKKSPFARVEYWFLAAGTILAVLAFTLRRRLSAQHA